MLDNFELPILREAVQIVNGRFETEASGGITIHKVRKVAKTGVDYISSGALTHSAQSMDISLKVIKDQLMESFYKKSYWRWTQFIGLNTIHKPMKAKAKV